MRKTYLKLAVLILAVTFLFILTGSVKAATEPELLEFGATKIFFANGTPITIEERIDGEEGAKIVWDGGELLVEPTTDVFGGMHNNDEEIETSITINGGYVEHVFGGGLHKSNTKTTEITMNGGQVGQIDAAGASSWIAKCGCSTELINWQEGDYENAPCQVGTANLTINYGTVCNKNTGHGIIFGGGCGYSYTQKANVVINDGEFANTWVVAAGSHGSTDYANLTIHGGKLGIVQTINRGVVKEANLEVNGGEIANLYVGGETADSSVTATAEKITAKIYGGFVENLEIGSNGGVEIPTDSNIATVEYLSDAVFEVANSVRENANCKEMVLLSLDGEEQYIEAGSKLSEAKLPDTEKYGYTFLGYYNADNMKVELDDEITVSLELTSRYEEKIITEIKDENSDTVTIKADETTKVTNSVLETIIASDKKLVIEDGIATWEIDPSKITDKSLEISSTKATLTLDAPERVKEVEELTLKLKDVKYLNFEHHGKLPGKIMITINVDYEDGKTIYINHYNEDTKQLENEQTVTVENRMISLEFEHFSTYVLATESIKVAEKPSEDKDTQKPSLDADKDTQKPSEDTNTEKDTGLNDNTNSEKDTGVNKETNTQVNSVEKNQNNLVSPKTGDTILSICGILIIAIIVSRVYSLKKNNSKH